jgi:hypothetical protein
VTRPASKPLALMKGDVIRAAILVHQALTLDGVTDVGTIHNCSSIRDEIFRSI